MRLNKLKDKKIVILGFGREGQDTLKFLRKKFPKKIIGVADQKQFSISSFQFPNIKWHLGEDYIKSLKNYDVIVKSPGIPFKLIEPFVSPRQKITSQTEIFFENCPCQIVGITGTKGKSTTASMIYRVLKSGGIKAYLVGNIGKPALSLLEKVAAGSVFVYELSSHQLYRLKKSPHIAVLLNIYPEHLDYYHSFEEYVAAKANITLHQKKSDYLIYNSQDARVKKIARRSKAQKIPIKGKYYKLNMAAAGKVGEIFKIPAGKIKKALEDFEFLPHRLELVGEFRGIKFYNDSLSTIPETAIEALDYLGEDVETLILGGFDRGLDFGKLAKRIVKSKVKTLILFPATGSRIWREVSKAKPRSRILRHFFVKDMKKAVELAYLYTSKGKICLLSPASPSFGLFKDYEERGNLFKKFIKKMKNGK